MFAPPVEAPSWNVCTVQVDGSALSNRDRKLLRKAKKRIGRLTGIRFVKSKSNPIPGIRVEYRYTDNFAIAQTATQSDHGKIIWAGIQLFNEYWTVARQGQVLKHELLHAVGVGHSNNRRSLMYHQHLPGQTIPVRLKMKLRSKYRHCL